ARRRRWPVVRAPAGGDAPSRAAPPAATSTATGRTPSPGSPPVSCPPPSPPTRRCPTMSADDPHRIAYVLKMYPRFSETFIVSEILAREAAGEEIVIFSLRPPADARFHPELARVQATGIQVGRSARPRRLWEAWGAAMAAPQLARSLGAHLDELVGAGVVDAEQALAVAMLAREHGVTHLLAHFASMATTVARL